MHFNPGPLSPKPTAPASSSGTQGGRKSADIIRGIEGKYNVLAPGVDKVTSLRGYSVRQFGKSIRIVVAFWGNTRLRTKSLRPLGQH